MDIYERLKKDHDRQRELIEQIKQTSGDSEERRDLWERLRVEAESHADAEEQVFYATLIAEPKGQEKARHSVAEHKEMSDIANELDDMDMSSPGWLNRFHTFADKLIHHVDEEEDEVFPLSREVIAGSKAVALVSDFDGRKRSEARQHA